MMSRFRLHVDLQVLLIYLVAGFPVYAESMNEGMMMDPGGMKGMMPRMMGGLLPPGIDPALLPEPQSQDARLFARYCGQCHQLPGPGMHTAQEWPGVVESMNRRMQMMSGRRGMMGMMMGGIEVPDPSELQVLISYLQLHAQRPLDRSQYSDLDTPAGKAFQSTCSRCHALPDPKQHSQDEWSGVVARMKENMIAMGKTVPDEATFEEIVAFLQSHARGR